ncbi:uncharacterized protein GVI51_F07073 [Nakaseomyces glabratus]|nr:Mitochondrial biogenesis regulation protein 1 [Nakaseomyces glabratus]KAH7589598.1 Mitochondrial biogenesis regulation protein 1 [Nakaseomyces glabratus]KAH7594769.1 Mitochondrial biogenesis regulation protein 1 [Nakaseomyces glabratus]KAH7604267.1 Mitochondrial biogenesis regulation protein 1 [Nakaseomyces glabratus]KAH7605253.1 Mitochondrial biogenesis regulation protein 1 [Nakaseomyces glabratus]
MPQTMDELVLPLGRSASVLDVFERAVQDPCSLDIDEQDETDMLDRDYQGYDAYTGAPEPAADNSALVKDNSFVASICPSTGLDPLQEEEDALCEKECAQECAQECASDEQGKRKLARRASAASSTSCSYVSDTSSCQSVNDRVNVLNLDEPNKVKEQEYEFRNPFKEKNERQSAEGQDCTARPPMTPSARASVEEFKLRRTQTEPEFPIRPSVLSRRNTCNMLHQINTRSQSIQVGRSRAPSLRRISTNGNSITYGRSGVSIPMRSNSTIPARSNSTTFMSNNIIRERSNSATPVGDSPSRTYSRGSFGIPTHLYSLEKYVSSQLDALATKEYDSEAAKQVENQRELRNKRSNTVSYIGSSPFNRTRSNTESSFGANQNPPIRCGNARKKSFIELSLENSFAS